MFCKSPVIARASKVFCKSSVIARAWILFCKSPVIARAWIAFCKSPVIARAWREEKFITMENTFVKKPGIRKNRPPNRAW